VAVGVAGGRGVHVGVALGSPVGKVVAVAVGGRAVGVSGTEVALGASVGVDVGVAVGGTQSASKLNNGGGLAELLVPAPQTQPCTVPGCTI